MNILFLDIDGVFNCQLFYSSPQYKMWRGKSETHKDYDKNQICKERIGWFNQLCKDTDAKVVISSTWRQNHTVAELQELFNSVGGTFTIIDSTPILRSKGIFRGNEIQAWLEDNIFVLTGLHYYDYNTYAIIDDDSDMLLWQKDNFFQTDNYSGLTPTTCHKIKRFLTRKYF